MNPTATKTTTKEPIPEVLGIEILIDGEWERLC